MGLVQFAGKPYHQKIISHLIAYCPGICAGINWYPSQNIIHLVSRHPEAPVADLQVQAEARRDHQVQVLGLATATATQVVAEGFLAPSSARETVDQVGGGTVQITARRLIGNLLVRGEIASTEEWKFYRLWTWSIFV